MDTGCSDSANARQSKAPSADGCADVYCDGACLGNPGPGGYAALVRFAGRPDHQLSGGKPRTTNNEMELSGAIAGLRAAISLGASTIKVQSDSEYLIKGITKWVAGWQRNGWKTSTGGAVKNRALWEELSQLCAGRSVTWSWIRGHSGHTENERCDDLAVSAAKQYAPRRTF
ncbi:MAG: ribonuclease HI [Chloroflexi bacterium]|nr:ribonuclease HI [Chloroflexota bacterium]